MLGIVANWIRGMPLHDVLAFSGKFAVAVILLIAAVILLTFFFQWRERRSSERRSGIRVEGLHDIFEPDESYDLLLSSGQRIQQVTFVGRLQSEDASLDYAVRDLCIWRKGDGQKIVIRFGAVRVFEQVRRS